MLVASGFCDKHKLPEPVRRGEAGDWHRLYATKRWKQIRAKQLLIEPFCAECEDRVRATDVDHVIPHRGDKNLFYDESNLQSLCHSHHSKKTFRENGTPPGK